MMTSPQIGDTEPNTSYAVVRIVGAVTTPSDEQLLAEHIEGLPDRFELLVRRHSQELYRFLARFTGSGSLAEDLVQEAFLQVHLAASGFDPSRRFKPWLFTIAANKARDLLRSKGRRPEVPLDAYVGSSDEEGGQTFRDFMSDNSADPVSGLEGKEERDQVRAVLARMPEHLREVLVLSYYHQFPYREIADILGVPLGTVKSRLHAAVAHFGRAYKAAAGGRSVGGSGGSGEGQTGRG
jgi:RNA polymerase sigma-70 factor, ECF subfamily